MINQVKPYPKDKDNAPRSASTLETTPDDYNLFTAAVLQKKILKPATYDILFKQQLRIRSKFQMGHGCMEGFYHGE